MGILISFGTVQSIFQGKHRELKNLENTGNTQGILIFGKIQGKDRKFVCLRSKFIALGWIEVTLLKQVHPTCKFCT